MVLSPLAIAERMAKNNRRDYNSGYILWSRKNKTFLVNVQGMSLFLSASPTQIAYPRKSVTHADSV